MTTETRTDFAPHPYTNLRHSGRYVVKCDDCKRELGRTDSMRRSAQGGRCSDCWPRTGCKYLITSSGAVRSGVYEVIGPQEHNGLYPCRKLDAKMKPMAYLDFDRIRACGGSVIAAA